VVIIDDQLAVRRGVELLLREAGFAIAGTGAIDDAAGLLRGRRHDVALLEICPRQGDGVQFARDVLRERPGAPLVLTTTGTAPGAVLAEAAELGAPGFVLKSSSPQVLVDALRAVAAGGSFRDPELDRLLSPSLSPSRHLARVASLTPREREILGLLADGWSGPEIAGRLVISIETVRTHIANATAKLGARTRVQAVALVVRGALRP
jgi:DNA-binding NarL/FixJ family response regulator